MSSVASLGGGENEAGEAPGDTFQGGHPNEKNVAEFTKKHWTTRCRKTVVRIK